MSRSVALISESLMLSSTIPATVAGSSPTCSQNRVNKTRHTSDLIHKLFNDLPSAEACSVRRAIFYIVARSSVLAFCDSQGKFGAHLLAKPPRERKRWPPGQSHRFLPRPPFHKRHCPSRGRISAPRGCLRAEASQRQHLRLGLR